MNPKINGGGPAFPRTESTGNLGNSTTEIVSVGGMSLRDYFAGQALANEYTDDTIPSTDVARWAYKVADAMLKVREVKP